MSVKTEEALQIDPREKEDWFLRLPEQAKEDFRRRFQLQKLPREGEMQRQGRMTQCLIDGSIIYLPAEFIIYGLSPWSALITLAMGLALGMLWFRTAASRIVLTILGAVVVRAICGLGGYLMMVFYLAICVIVCRATTLTREPGRSA